MSGGRHPEGAAERSAEGSAADDRLAETVVDTRVVYEGRYLIVRVDTIEDPEGGRHRREFVDHPGAIAVLALDGDDLLLVRQFRHAAGRPLLELPAGTLERIRDGETEPPDEAAPRELEEETGYRAGRWRKLGNIWMSPGSLSEELHLYLAQDLERIEGYGGPAADERLDLVRLPWRDLLDAADRGEVHDAKTLAGVFWLARLGDRGELDG